MKTKPACPIAGRAAGCTEHARIRPGIRRIGTPRPAARLGGRAWGIELGDPLVRWKVLPSTWTCVERLIPQPSNPIPQPSKNGPPSHTQTLGTGRGVACRRIEEPHTDSGPGRGVASSVSQQAHRPPFLVCLRYVAHVCRCALLLVWFSGAPACRPEPVLHPAIAPPSVTHQRVRATTHTLITRRCL